MSNPFLSRLLSASAHSRPYNCPTSAIARLKSGFAVTGADGASYRFTADRTFKHLIEDHVSKEAHLRLIRLEWAEHTVVQPWATNDYVERGYRPNGRTPWSRNCKAFVGLFDPPHNMNREAMLVRAMHTGDGLVITYHTVTPLAKVEEILDEVEIAHNPDGAGYTVSYRSFEPKVIRRTR